LAVTGMIVKVRRLCSTGLIFLDVRDGATTYQLCCNNKRLDGAMMDDIVKNYKPGDVCTAAGYLQVAPRTGAVKSQIVECFSIRVVEQWTAVHKHGFLFDKARQLPRVAADAPEGRRFSILVQCNGLYAQRTFDYLSARYKGTGMETRLFSKLAGQKEHIIGIANSPGDVRAPAARATAPPPAPPTPSDASPARQGCLARAVRHMGLWRAQLGWRVVCVVGGEHAQPVCVSCRGSSLNDDLENRPHRVKGAACGFSLLTAPCLYLSGGACAVYYRF
jgi:hypothetical protein